MRLDVCAHGPALALAVKRFYKEHKHLVAITTIDKRIALYGADTAVDALIEARTDYPKGEVMGEYEYLDPATIAAMRSGAMQADPVAQAMRHLGVHKETP